jgi:hypothetical protein
MCYTNHLILGEPVVYLIEERTYGWDLNPPAYLPIGSVLVPASLATSSGRQYMTYFEDQSHGFEDHPDLYIPLAKFPIVSLHTYVVLTHSRSIEVGDRVYCLRLYKEDREIMEAGYSHPRRSLEAVGLRAGITYSIEAWVIPGKAIRISGVKGVYYAGIFENASNALALRVP